MAILNNTHGWMVMDASRVGCRRYWDGHAWVDDPSRGIWSRDSFGVSGNYFDLVEDGCSAALVQIESSQREFNGYRVTVVHKIQICERVIYFG